MFLQPLNRLPQNGNYLRSFSVLISVFLLLFVACSEGGCAVETVKKYAIQQTALLETDFVRGVSTKADVLRLLGEPDGAGQIGGFYGLRGMNHVGEGPYDAWYYSSAQAALGLKMSSKNTDILVFFHGNVYEGFYWFTLNATGDYDAGFR